MILKVTRKQSKGTGAITANAILCLNLHNNFRFQSIHLLFGIDVAKPFPEMLCENQT